MKRIDDIDALYRPSKVLDKICMILFWLDIVVSIASIHYEEMAALCTTVLVIIALLYTALSMLNDLAFWYRAECARRKNSYKFAFEVDFDKYETVGYYNNSIKDPEISYAVSMFESSFFTKEISEKMVPRAIAEILFAVAALLGSCRLISNSEIVLVVTQAVFSSTVFEKNIRTLVFAQKIKNLFNDAYREFITVGITNQNQMVWLRYFCTEYESVKAHYRVRLNERIFTKTNARLSEEWEKLLHRIKIGEKN